MYHVHAGQCASAFYACLGGGRGSAGAAGVAVCASFLEEQYRMDYQRRLCVLAGQELRTLQDEHTRELLMTGAPAYSSRRH